MLEMHKFEFVNAITGLAWRKCWPDDIDILAIRQLAVNDDCHRSSEGN